VKFETTPAFDADYRRLKAEHAAEFKKVVRDRFVPACDAFAKDPATPWPSSLRVDDAHRNSPELLSEIPHPGLLPG